MNDAELARVATQPQVPPDERRDAQGAMQRTYAPTRSELPDPGAMKTLVDQMLHAYEMQALDAYAKAAPSGDLWRGTGIAATHARRPGQPALRKASGGGPISIFTDEYGVFGAAPGSYRRRPSQFQPEHLTLMVEQVPVMNAVIVRRQRTLSRFLRPSERSRDLYFEVRKNDPGGTIRPRRGATETALEQFLLHSGWEPHPAVMKRESRDPLRTFIAKGVRDLLTLDTWAIETVPTRNGHSLASYYAVDGGTIFLTSDEGYQGNPDMFAVQIVNGIPMTGYTHEQLSFTLMNPRTSVYAGGYGYPPPEMVVKVVTGYMHALNYNLRGFDANALPKGLLTLVGEYDTRELVFFRQQWNALVRGVNNAWALPVLVSQNRESAAHFEKFGVEFSDMYFAKWMVLLTSLVCAVYGMDPAEVYSESFSAGRSSLSGTDTAARLAEARDSGLEPLLAFIEDVLTGELLARIEPDYVVRFHGIQPEDQAWRHEVFKTTLSVNELRAQEGLEPTAAAWGDAPVNPTLHAACQAQPRGGPG